MGGIAMNTSDFLEGYKEIERLIQENLEEIRQAYNVPKKYEFDLFFIDESEEINIVFFFDEGYEYDYDFVSIPLEWFESDDVLKSNLAEVINKKEE